MPCVWHLRVHQWDGEGDFALSLDFQRHLDGLPEQADVIDMLLEMPKPLPTPPPPPPRTPSPPAKPVAPESPADTVKRPGRMRHTLLTDALIFKFVEVRGPRWRALARSLGGRAAGYSDDVVRNRYIRVMDALGLPYVSPTPHNPGREKPAKQCSRWTEEEDAAVRAQVHGLGTPWATLQRDSLPGRTPQAVRNRANRLGLVGRSVQ